MSVPEFWNEHLRAMNFLAYRQQATSICGGLRTGRGVGVAILDTGISLECDRWFRDAVCEVWKLDVIGRPERVYTRSQAHEQTPFPYRGDPIGHGSIMSQMIGSENLGAAPHVDLYCYQLPYHGFFDPNVVLHALNHVLSKDEVSVVNMAFGSWVPCGSPTPLPWEPEYEIAIDALMNAGKVVVMAAGNEDQRRFHTGLPGRIRNGITVGSARKGPNEWKYSEFSLCYAWPNHAERVPNCYVPGEELPYRDHRRPDAEELRTTGTSPATALCSGIVAMTLEMFVRPLTRTKVETIQSLVQMTGIACEPNPEVQPGQRVVIDIVKLMAEAYRVAP